MTVCVATVCDEGFGLVLVADKKVGKGWIEGEPEISKVQVIHPQWFMMISGEDIAPLFELADLARAELKPAKDATLEMVMETMQRNYELVRMKRAEATHLKPLGWTITRFNDEGNAKLSNFDELQARIANFELLDVDVLVAGFDKTLNPPAKIFTMGSYSRGIPGRHDIPGFAAIGSGGIGAGYMLFYRNVSHKLPMRAAVYYALEAKYFSEFAGGVGEKTDLYAIAFNGAVVRVSQIHDAKTIEKKLIPICERLISIDPEPEDIEVLNSLKELEGFPMLPIKKKKKVR